MLALNSCVNGGASSAAGNNSIVMSSILEGVFSLPYKLQRKFTFCLWSGC